MGSRVSVDGSVRVVVVGGGFGGIEAASLLKSWAIPFVLLDVRDAFHHNVAALRAAVERGEGCAGLRGLPPAWVPAGQPAYPRSSEVLGSNRERGAGSVRSAPAMAEELLFSV